MTGEHSSNASDQERLRLLAALRESEILRELGELLASSLDIEHILNVLVRRTTEACEVERCAVWLYEEHRAVFVPAAYYLSSPHLDSQDIKAAAHIWYRSTLPGDDTVIRRLIEERTLFVPDLRSEPSMRFVADTFLVRSVLLLALVREGQVVGLMTLDDPGKSRTFSPEQVQMARAIAQQAAIAIGNGRLYQQAQMERRRAEQLIKRVQAINQVATAVNTGEDLADVLAIALDSLVHVLDASGGLIVLLEGDTPVVVSSKQLKAREEEAPAGITLSELTHCQQAARSGLPLLTGSEQTTGREQDWYKAQGLAHMMVIPLMAGAMRNNGEATAHEEKRRQPYCLGFAIANYLHEPRQLSHGQFAFAQDIAAQCALAVEKQRLLEDAHEAAALAMERANTLDAVLQSLTEGITVITQDHEVVIGNKAASRFLGVPVGAGEQLHTFLHRFPSMTLDGQPIQDEDFPVSRALRGERIRRERFMTYRVDGARRVVEVNVTPMFDEQKQQVGVVSAFRDITEQVEAEEHIQHALETMLKVAEAVSGLTDIYDIQRRVLQLTLSALACERGVVYLYDNTRHIFTPLLSTGFVSDNEQQWLSEQNRWLSPTIDEFQEFKEQLIQGHALLLHAEQFRRTTGSLANPPSQPPMILAAPITHNERLLGLMLLDRSSNPQQNHFSLWDMAMVEGISELAGLAIEQAYLQEEATSARANEAAMREANALKDEFMSITAHEFRTPLTVILAHCQMLLRTLRRSSGDLGKNDDVIDSLSTIEKQTHLLTDIVNAFLEVTQINRGQLTLKTEEVDLVEIAHQVVTNYSATSSNHQVSCVIEPCPNDYLVKGDNSRLLQVMGNLVQNAIKYSPLGGPVTVRLRQRILSEGTSMAEKETTGLATSVQRKRLIEVCVEDKGMGVPKDAQAHLFERFYRASNTQGSKVRGVGLGLYLVAELLRLHGGSIRVESSGIPGEGSNFIFTLPALERDLENSE